MTPPFLNIMVGDALEQLRLIDSESVQCVVTSPPYWGLRDYSRCECAAPASKQGGINRRMAGFQARWEGRIGNYEDEHGDRHTLPGAKPFHQYGTPNPTCTICRGSGVLEEVKEKQIGLEKTLEEYVAKMVEIFREVKRVLRKDGTLWLNMGDCYAGSGKTQGQSPNAMNLGRSRNERPYDVAKSTGVPRCLKPKDLVGMPWRLAFALQADGWYLRSDIIWGKPNPMPESVRDRPTKAHEYIFLLTRSSRYYYDQDAIREESDTFSLSQPCGWDISIGEGGHRSIHRNGRSDGQIINEKRSGHNKRSVWEIATQPYSEAHFATFPEELPEICIKAGTSKKGCCAVCGAPQERIVENNRPEGWKDKGPTTDKETELRAISKELYGGNQKSRSLSDIYGRATKSIKKTTGWQPTCNCDSGIIPCTVLDPFAGSGTTGQVARRLGRSSILIELNPEYISMIKTRTAYDHRPLDEFDIDQETDEILAIESELAGKQNAGDESGGD